MFSKPREFPPYELIDKTIVEQTAHKTRKLERLYHLTQSHAWDGKELFGQLVEKHGPPGTNMDPEVRESLSKLMTVLMWGELAAWNISADLALEIDDMDAKMAATGQVFDEARHFYVMRDYVLALGPAKQLGGLPKRLLTKVLDAPTLACKLVGMQLLFETNAVVMFRRIGESGICPILEVLLPYFERDESRHVGLGVMYVPRLVKKMGRREALLTRKFQLECIALLAASGFTLHEDFKRLGMNQRQMASRVTHMQDEIVRQMADEQGDVLGAVLTKGRWGEHVIDFVHPEGGIAEASPFHQSVHSGLTRTFKALDRAWA